MATDNRVLLRLLHQCAHRLSASEKYRGQGRILNLLRGKRPHDPAGADRMHGPPLGHIE